MGESEAVAAVLLDSSALLAYREEPSALQSLLRRLRHLGIQTGIVCGESIPDDEVDLLKKMAIPCDHFFQGSPPSLLEAVNSAWKDILFLGPILCVFPSNKRDTCIQLQLAASGWLFAILDVEHAIFRQDSSMVSITKLEQLPLVICNLNRKAMGSHIVTVAYLMKSSRQDDFTKRGAFPIKPTPNGLIFLPLTFALPLSLQLQEADVVLHKATDEIISVELSDLPDSPSTITYTSGMQELQSYLKHHPECIAIDPLSSIYPVLDRMKIQQLLLGLEDLNSEGHCAIRGPHFLKVDDFSDVDLVEKLAAADLCLPSIVKPQVACGVAYAHTMAFAYKIEDFKDLNVPCPAIVQEYVDHSSTLFKFYVLGKKIFYAVKRSTPNASTLIKLSKENGSGAFLFDSLKSLPTGGENAGKESSSLDINIVSKAANWLAKTLNLTIFGFDVVIQEGSGDHVIVDVNYLPSFKEVADDIAVPALWDAIKTKFESEKTKQNMASHNRV